ncbi:MAG: nicotianamine synthase family protein [Rhodomicrobium sp.]
MIELRESSAVDTVIGKIVAVHALLTNEGDLSPRNQKISTALRELVDLLLRSYSSAEAAAIVNHPEVTALRISLLDRLSEAESALERFWSQRFRNRKTLHVRDLREFLYWRNYERLLGMELKALAAIRRFKARKHGEIVFVGGGPLPLSAIVLHMRTGKPVLCVDADAEASECAGKLLAKLSLFQVSAVHTDGVDFDYGGASAIFIASLTNRKMDVAKRIVETCKEPVVAVRTVDGVRALLYRPADLAALKAAGLSLAGQTKADAETINSTLFFNAAARDAGIAPCLSSKVSSTLVDLDGIDDCARLRIALHYNLEDER